ncbi:MAG: hypothetical protein WB699_07550, partial [Bacteroidota bacterium]
MSNSQIICKSVVLGLCLMASTSIAQQSDRVNLGGLETGATVSFVRAVGGEWGIEISGGAAPRLAQLKPVKIEILQSGNAIRKLAAGYNSVLQSDSEVEAHAELAFGDSVVFRVLDRWRLSGAVVSVRRMVKVLGNAPGGFNSSIVFTVDPSVRWAEVNCLAPGALYGDPAYDGDRSPGGTLNYTARQFILREDMMPAPLFALSFRNGCSVAMLDPSPNGASTVEETKLTKEVMTDARFQFGAVGAWQAQGAPIEFGFQFPGTMSMYPFGPNAPKEPKWFRRLHPIAQGFTHSYEVRFRFGVDESFRSVTRNVWRWAWSTLKPEVTPIDVEQMRRVLIDHLAAQAATID